METYKGSYRMSRKPCPNLNSERHLGHIYTYKIKRLFAIELAKPIW